MATHLAHLVHVRIVKTLDLLNELISAFLLLISHVGLDFVHKRDQLVWIPQQTRRQRLVARALFIHREQPEARTHSRSGGSGGDDEGDGGEGGGGNDRGDWMRGKDAQVNAHPSSPSTYTLPV